MSSGFWIVRSCFTGLLIFALHSGPTLAAPSTTDADPTKLGVLVNMGAAYPFLGTDFLGRSLGLSDAGGVRVGGFAISEFDWVAAGGVKPRSAFGSVAVALHALIDTEKVFHIPGAAFGIEFGGTSFRENNNAAGSVQLYTSMDGAEPRNRIELTQLWWRQRLFDGKLTIHVGKLNGSVFFGTVSAAAPVSELRLLDAGITNLIYPPTACNPTCNQWLPGLYNSAFGVVMTFAPTPHLTASYGIFDGNGAQNMQTGLQWYPKVNNYKFHIGEIDYTWRLGESGMPGRLGVGAWRETGRFLTPYLTYEDGATGYYAFASQRLWYQRSSRDNSGLIGFIQYGHSGSGVAIESTYYGGGLTGVGLLPGRPGDTISLGAAFSQLNNSPYAGAIFFPKVPSDSMRLRSSELMLQAVYQAVLAPRAPANPWLVFANLA